jgi:hypothetical protein
MSSVHWSALLLSVGSSVATAAPLAAMNFDGAAGNGAEAVVCAAPRPELGGRTAMLLDLFEAAKWGLTLDVGPDGAAPADRAAALIGRLAARDPDRHARYLAHLAAFDAEALRAPNLSLPVDPDRGTVALPGPDCDVVTLAHQQVPELPGDERYAIREEIWSQLDDGSRAALIVHEIVEREALEQTAAVGRRRVRYFTAELASTAMAPMTVDAYADLLDTYVHLPAQTIVAGAVLDIRNQTRDAEGHLRSGIVRVGSFLVSGRTKVQVTAGDTVSLYPSGTVERIDAARGIDNVSITPLCRFSDGTLTAVTFGQDGMLTSFVRDPEEDIYEFPICSDRGTAFTVEYPVNEVFEFHPSGAVKVLNMYPEDIAPFIGKSCEEYLYAAAGSKASYYPNGRLASGILGTTATLCDLNGELHMYDAGTVFTLDEQGHVLTTTRR